MLWYWSLVALALAVILISRGRRAGALLHRQKIIDWTDRVLMRVPLLNKFYGAIKQVNDAFAGTGIRSRPSCWWNFPGREIIPLVLSPTNNKAKSSKRPARNSSVSSSPPRPIRPPAFLILVPEEKLTKLNMSVTNAIKYIVSLGAISQEYTPAPNPKFINHG